MALNPFKKAAEKVDQIIREELGDPEPQPEQPKK